MNAMSILNVLHGWLYRDDRGTQRLDTKTPFEIVVRSTVNIKPGDTLLIDTLEVTDGKVIAVAYPRTLS